METGATVGWRLGLLAVLGLFVTAGLVRSCGVMDPIELPNYSDSLATLRAQYAADSAALRVRIRDLESRADSAVRVSRTANASASRLRRVADSLRVTRTGTLADTSPLLLDARTPLVAAYKLAVAEADTLRVGLDSSLAATARVTYAYRQSVEAAALLNSGWIRAEGQLSQERALFGEEREAWRGTVAKLKRGCRMLAVLPCMQVSVGYGAMLTAGEVRVGPTVAVSIPIRF